MMTNRFVFLLGIASMLWSAIAIASPELPGEPQKQPVVLFGGTIHPVTGGEISAGMVLFDKGRLVAIDKEIEVPKDARKIDVTGKHIYPGLFDAYTDMGLVEIGSIRATIDTNETGSINSSVKSWVAVNPDSEIIPVTRSNGVLLTLTAPAGGLIAGKSGVIQLDGWTWEDLTVRTDIGMHVNWPRMGAGRRERRGAPAPAASTENPLGPLRDALEAARAYQQARAANPDRHPIDARWEAMVPVLTGKLPLVVDADEMQQIQSAVAFAVEQKLRVIVHGGYDAAECAELLTKHNVPVIISGTYRLPMRDSDDYDAPFSLPERLRKAGVKFCISSTNRSGPTGVRNLAYHAAMAVAFGLPADDALKAITLYPAQILGVQDLVGSLESGKDATLIITTGDPLETTTQVEMAFVQGRQVDLQDRHKRLWKKYEEKYKRKGE